MSRTRDGLWYQYYPDPLDQGPYLTLTESDRLGRADCQCHVTASHDSELTRIKFWKLNSLVVARDLTRFTSQPTVRRFDKI